MKQEEVNKRLQYICEKLKSIPSIGHNYIEYMSALIYAMYENKRNLKEIDIQDISYIEKRLDDELEQIRQKENSMRLFINIRFYRIVNKENDTIFIEVINELSKLIIELERLEENSKPVLAEAFEYVIMRAAQNNKVSFNNREFYTPKGLVKTMVKLLDIQKNMAIYNPACGTGNFITESAKYGNIYVFGEENSMSNYNICITNLWLHDIYNKRIEENREEKFELVDVALANPPFVEEDLPTNEYYQYDTLSTNGYMKYMRRMIDSIRIEGKMAIILPHGFLFKKTKREYEARRRLIQHGLIDAIIALPEKLFYTTKIPVIILLISKTQTKNGILFIDASREYTSKRRTNILTVENQEKIVNTYKRHEIVPNYSYIANIEEIEENNYDLSIKKYVKFHNEIEDINQEEIERNVCNLEEERYEIQKQITKLIEDTKIR